MAGLTTWFKAPVNTYSEYTRKMREVTCEGKGFLGKDYVGYDW